jgi:CheY-like chemotaxis protein
MEASKSFQVLVVDDDESLRSVISCWLNSKGHQTIQASNGIEAFEKFNDQAIDFVITDIRMPNGDGAEFIARIRNTGSLVPIFAMSGFTDYSVEKLKQIGANHFLSKPFRLEELQTLLKK